MFKRSCGLLLASLMLVAVPHRAHAEDVIGSVDTAWALGGDHRIDMERVSDPRLPVTCYISHPVTGGFMGRLGLAKNHALFSLSCVLKRNAPATDLSPLPTNENVMTQRTSWFSKQLLMNRFVDKENHVVIYMVTAQNEFIDGSPFSSVSAVNMP